MHCYQLPSCTNEFDCQPAHAKTFGQHKGRTYFEKSCLLNDELALLVLLTGFKRHFLQACKVSSAAADLAFNNTSGSAYIFPAKNSAAVAAEYICDSVQACH